MNRIIEWFKLHWQKHIFKVSTGYALVLLYLQIFHHTAVNQLIDNIVDSPDFITALVGALTVYLFGTKKF